MFIFQNVPVGDNFAGPPMGGQGMDYKNNGDGMGPDQRGGVPQAQKPIFDNNNAVQQPGAVFHQLPQRNPYPQNAPRAWPNVQRQEHYPRPILETVGYRVAPCDIYTIIRSHSIRTRITGSRNFNPDMSIAKVFEARAKV